MLCGIGIVIFIIDLNYYLVFFKMFKIIGYYIILLYLYLSKINILEVYLKYE